MKKIISMIAAVAMLSTMFVSTASAVVTGKTVTITSAKEAMTVADYIDMTGSLISEEEYDAYKITVSLSGIGELTTDGRTKYSGRMISNLDYRVTFDNPSNVDTSVDLYAEEGLVGAGDFKWVDDATYAVVATDPYPGKSGDEATDTIDGAYEIYVAVKKNTQVTATVKAEMQIDTYVSKEPTADDVETYNNIANFITLSPATITLGEAPAPAPSKPVITGTDASKDVTVTDDNKGKVWNNVKIDDIELGTNYKVEFTDGSDSETFDLNLGEISGDISFAVILKTAKDLANIAMKIICDAAN